MNRRATSPSINSAAVLTLACRFAMAQAAPAARPTPTAAQVLGQYAESQRLLDRCRLSVDTEVASGSPTGKTVVETHHSEFLRDGDAARLTVTMWRGARVVPASAQADDHGNVVDYDTLTESVNSPAGVISYYRDATPGGEDKVVIDAVSGQSARELPELDTFGVWVRGWDPTESDRIDRILASDPSVRISKSQQAGDGGGVYVVAGSASSGSYSVCFDTSRGGAIVRMRIVSGPLNLIGDTPLWQAARSQVDRNDPNLTPERQPFGEKDKNVSQVVDVDGVELAPQGPLWFPQRMTVHVNLADRNGRHWLTVEHLRVTSLDIAPTFGGDAFKLAVPNGTTVYLTDGMKVDGVPRVWKDGRAVPAVNENAVEDVDKQVSDALSAPKVEVPTGRSMSGFETILFGVTTLLLLAGFGWLFARRRALNIRGYR